MRKSKKVTTLADLGFITAENAATKLDGEAMPKLLADFHREVVGAKVVCVAYEVSQYSGEAVPVIILNNGVVIQAWRDDERNGPGVLLTDKSFLCQTRLKSVGAGLPN